MVCISAQAEANKGRPTRSVAPRSAGRLPLLQPPTDHTGARGWCSEKRSSGGREKLLTTAEEAGRWLGAPKPKGMAGLSSGCCGTLGVADAATTAAAAALTAPAATPAAEAAAATAAAADAAEFATAVTADSVGNETLVASSVVDPERAGRLDGVVPVAVLFRRWLGVWFGPGEEITIDLSIDRSGVL